MKYLFVKLYNIDIKVYKNLYGKTNPIPINEHFCHYDIVKVLKIKFFYLL